MRSQILPLVSLICVLLCGGGECKAVMKGKQIDGWTEAFSNLQLCTVLCPSLVMIGQCHDVILKSLVYSMAIETISSGFPQSSYRFSMAVMNHSVQM